MTIDIYYIRYSPPCRAVHMTAKQLNIDLNIKVVDLSKGEHLTEDYLKINPGHTVPAIDDNGFILWESKAIMQYLCNKYAPDSDLYPRDPKKRALVDRWLNFDTGFFSQLREAVVKPNMAGIPASESTTKAFKANLKLLDTLIADNKYLVGNSLTIADLAVIATTCGLPLMGYDLSEYSNFNTWLSKLSAELPYFDEINKFEEGEVAAFMDKLKAFYARLMSSAE